MPCRRLLAVVLLLMLASACFGSALRESMTLDPLWRVKPAENPDAVPADGDWGECRPGRPGLPASGGGASVSSAGRWASWMVERKGTTWEKVKFESVHNVWYEQKVNIPAEWIGRRLVLDFQRIEGDGIIFMNNRRVGELLRPGGEVDVTSFAVAGANRLNIFMTRNYTGISRNFDQDVLRKLSRKNLPMGRWGLGVSGLVTLHALPADQRITDALIETSWRKKQITLNVEVECARPISGAIIAYDIIDASGAKVLSARSAPADFPAGVTRRQVTAEWANPIPWELDGPYLYRAQVSLEQINRKLDQLSNITFGFREIWTEGRELMMNGHASRWRLNDSFGLNAESIPLLQQLGANVMQIQPNPTLWWRDWTETPIIDEATLRAMDEAGMGATVPAPGINNIRYGLLKDPEVRKAYTREMNLHLRRYRNHPSILAWAVGMNSYNPQSAIHADGMGLRMAEPLPDQAKAIELACQTVKSIDPTRLTFSHADGGVGDMCTANVYLNFIPLQEREEWPLAWAQSGNMPYSAIEMGQPFTANFFKGKQQLITEYTAMYLGERAYQLETLAGQRDLTKTALKYTTGTLDLPVNLKDYPAYWEFQKLFVRNTDRAWRTWGINGGWLYWVLTVGYGDPPGSSKSWLNRYAALAGKPPVTTRPSWANPNFDIHAADNQPLLAYIGGDPIATDKTHGYFAGEKLRKNIVVVWDGPGRRNLTAAWRLIDRNEKILDGGSKELSVSAGDILKHPIEATVPNVTQRGNLILHLEVRDGGAIVATDQLAVQAFPAFRAGHSGRVALYDPAGKSGVLLKQLGFDIVVADGQTLPAGTSCLVIGRQALRPGDKLPYGMKDVASGLRVVILEQRPEVWEALGFRCMDVMPRYVFPRGLDRGLLAGLETEDLINWRGSPDLLPERKAARQYAVQRGPKWTNRHAVASTVIQIPQSVGFTPLLQCEFDLDYTPALEWRYGKGAVYFSTLDLTGRIGVDPAASQLASNLFTVALQEHKLTRTVMYAGGPAGRKTVDALQTAVTPVNLDVSDALLILGENHGLTSEQIQTFLIRGGHIFNMAQTKSDLTGRQIQSEPRELWRTSLAEMPLQRGTGLNQLRWRDALHINAITSIVDGKIFGDGLIALQETPGLQVYFQADVNDLAGRYADNAAKKEAVQLSVIRLQQLQAQLLTNMGATPSNAVVTRLGALRRPPAFDPIMQWQGLGPIPVADSHPSVLGKPLPGESDAIVGDTNPNTTYALANGKTLMWHKSIAADQNGFVNLQQQLRTGQPSVAYMTRVIHSDSERDAQLKLGADYFLVAWLNGSRVAEMISGHGTPRRGRITARLHLRKGENVLTLKVLAGSGGFGFWSDLSQNDATEDAASADIPAQDVLYRPLTREFDPYEFFYW